jgi:hypothetical protein
VVRIQAQLYTSSEKRYKMGESTKLMTKAPEAKKENTVSQAHKPEPSQTRSSPVDHILFLQRNIGNRAVQRLLESGTFQAKLQIGKPNDGYEQEADKVAEAVMRMPEPQSQRRQEEGGILRARQVLRQFPVVNPTPESRIQSLRGAGQPLPDSTLAFFEPRFGADFGQVRLHTDSKAVATAAALGARAFTYGSDVWLGRGESPANKKLLAHELTHVMQQNNHINLQAAVSTKSPQDVAMDLINAFANDTSSPQAFPKLRKEDIVNGLRARVAVPSIINQAGLNACGPAAAAYIFASTDIVGYTKMAIDLYKYGEASSGSYTVEAGSDLRSHGPDDYTNWGTAGKPEPIDWMVLSSMRDSENWWFDFEGGPSETFSAITMPGEMDEWLEDFIGFKDVVDDTNLVFTKSVDHLMKVNSEYSSGKFVILFINANMIAGATKKAAKKAAKGITERVIAGSPDHYVVLRSNVTVTENSVSMEIWTWGGRITISPTKEIFESNYYGAIFAK